MAIAREGTSDLALRLLGKFDRKAIALLHKYGKRFGYMLVLTEEFPDGTGGFNIISNGYAAYRRDDPKSVETCLKLLKQAAEFIETGKVTP